MEPPSSVPSAPRSGEDLSRAFRNLPPGTLAGLDALCDHNYWLAVMRQAEIDISNEDIFRFRFAEISKTASNRLAFLAGSGEYGTFNLRYLIQQLVEQCADMHKYTRKLEKYVVKLQRQVQDLEAEQQQQEQQQQPQQPGGRQLRDMPGTSSGPGGGGPGSGAGGSSGSIGGLDGIGAGGMVSGSGGLRGAFTYPHPRNLGSLAGHQHLHNHHLLLPPGSKRPRTPAPGSVEAAMAAAAAAAAAGAGPGATGGAGDLDEE